ncbi:MFS general substrate transporter [Macrolepiota fuliginosa MF-IS2]|uniref:MFS general substrate transporter n=1 Tax=Macrolepiota fuliginosa MF-IS2 TaxID=1400762 RepID=A0A9P5XPK3_9AGAR|nr:MFS general substrate transporter [Macrolepiota fuliginosa MF-IS2]
MVPTSPQVSGQDTEKNATLALNPSSASLSTDVKELAQVIPQETVAQPPGPELPEGGYWAWSTVAGAWLVQFVNFGYVNAFGAYQDFYVREYLNQSTPSEIGWIGGVQICFTFSMGVVTGRLFDAGYFYWLNASSLILYAISIFMLSLSHPNKYYQVFLSHGIAFGLASGLSYLPSLSIVGHYFKRRRPLAVGIVSTGSALGAILQPIMLNNLFSSKIGFHNGVRISGAFNTFLLLVGICLMRTRLPPHKGQHPFPVERYFSDPAYLISVFGSMCAFLGLFFVVFYLQLYSVLHGVNETLAFYTLAILNGASIFGRIFPGLIAPKFGSLNLSIFFMIANGVVTAFMPLARRTVGIIIYAIFYGFISGATIALVAPMMVSLIDDPREFGTRLGIFFFFGGILGLVATPISGALLTKSYHWVSASVFAGVFCIVSGLLYLISRIIVARRKGTQIL